ncbi:MAG: hypothetical protein ACTSQY_04365 [Candidatus Odinarchaeia archaeon]
MNGKEATGTFTNIHYFWIFPCKLEEGVNTFTITATDDSEQRITVTDEQVLGYHPETYQGPSIH